MGLVRVKLENGMEASLPEEHALASGYKPLDKPAVNGAGIALEPTGAEEALAERAKRPKKSTTSSGDAGDKA